MGILLHLKQWYFVPVIICGHDFANYVNEWCVLHVKNYSAYMYTHRYICPVAQHFNPPSHCSINDFSVTGIIHCNCSNVNRLIIENRIVFKLGTLSPL